MLIAFLSMCFWQTEVVGYITITSQGLDLQYLDTSYSSPYHTQDLDMAYPPYNTQGHASRYLTPYDTNSDNLIYGDHSYYYYDEPVTKDTFPKPNADKLKFGLKSTSYFNSGGYKEADGLQSVKVKYSNVIGQGHKEYTRQNNKVDDSVSGSIDRTWYSGTDLLDGAKTISVPVFRNTADLFQKRIKDLTVDLHQPEYRNINQGKLRERHMGIDGRNNIRGTYSTTKSPNEILLREKQPSSPEKGYTDRTTIVPKGTDSTMMSPVVVDVTEIPVNQTVRQENLQARQNTTDQSENLSPIRRLGARIPQEGRSYVRGLMLSVLRRVDMLSNGNERRPVRF